MNKKYVTKYQYSQDEMMEAAKKFLTDLYGKPSEVANRDNWMEHFGLLLNFILEMFPSDTSNQK